MDENIEIIIGTYEEFLLGYRTELRDNKVVLVQSFADKSHAGSVRCVAVAGKYVVSGGVDDRIFVYDMKLRKQSQILQHHEGTVNGLAFTPDSTHLLSIGDDGHFVAVRLGSWQIEGNWRKAHGGAAVTHLSCHPSGKLALTLGSDLILRTWNLIKGRVAYKTNVKGKKTLGHTPDCIAWSTDGNFFTITGQRCIEIWSIKNADVLKNVQCNSKPICVQWLDDNHLLVGLENGKILIVTVDDEDEEEDVKTFDAHSSRVKCLTYNGNVLVSAASSGEIKMWKVNIEDKSLELLSTGNIGCRPTCIGILDTRQFGDNYFKVENVEEELIEPTPKIKQIKKRSRGVVIIEQDGEDAVTLEGKDEVKKTEKPNKQKNKKRKAAEETNKETSVNVSKPKTFKNNKKNKK